MTFHETQFPPRISFGATGGPRFQTEVAVVDSGVEYRNQAWSQALARYDVSHAARKKATFDILLAFFLAMHGRQDGFRFKDWSDYIVTMSQGVLAVIDSTHAQLYKRYTFGAFTYDRKITKLVANSVTFTGGTTPTLDVNTGIVTHAGAPSAWAGEFDVPCRFDTDDVRAEIINKNNTTGFIMGWQGIPIVELRL